MKTYFSEIGWLKELLAAVRFPGNSVIPDSTPEVPRSEFFPPKP